MTILWTLFAISLFGVVYIIGVKVFELKTTRLVFLPTQWQAQNKILEARWYRFWRMCVQTTKWLMRRVSVRFRHLFAVLIQHSKGLREWRGVRALEKNSNGSSFLVEVNNHKEEFRRQNGYHNE